MRRLAPTVTVVAAARQADHARQLQQSGATSGVVSSDTAGRMLGLATASPRSVDVVPDRLSFGHGLDLPARDVSAAELGRGPSDLGLPVVAVVRAGQTLHRDTPEATPLPHGDEIVYVGSSTAASGR